MKGKLSFLVLVLILVFDISAQAQIPLNRPEPALRLIAESIGDSCSICARQSREKAFQLLDQEFPVGGVFATTDSCFLMRSPAAEENELVLTCRSAGKESLPLLIFRFHTPANHLVGISPEDFTLDEPVAEYSEAAPEMALRGTLRIVAFRYGDRPSFSYSANRGVIQVQCRLLTLRRN